MTVAHDGGNVVSLTHWPPFTPRKYSWYSFLLEAEPTPGPQGDREDYVMTPSGIEPATFRFVARRLNHCANTVPRHTQYAILIAFPLQQCLHEHALMLYYIYIACLVLCGILNLPLQFPLNSCLFWGAACMPVIGLPHSSSSNGKDMNVKEALTILNTHFFIRHCTL